MKKFNLLFFCVLIVLLPFTALLGNILEYKTAISGSQVFWITHWYEIILPFALVLGLYSARKDKKVFGWSFFLAVFLVVYSTILVVFSSDRGRSLEGFRFTILPVLFFVITMLSIFTKEERCKLVKIYLIVSSVVAFWALTERFLPVKYWNTAGLINPGVIFGWGWHGAGGFLQSASFLGGPNQLASYLLPAFFLFLTLRSPFRSFLQAEACVQGRRDCPLGCFCKLKFVLNNIKIKIPLSTCYFLLATLTAFVIMFTQSRAAIIGLIVGLLIYIYLINKNKVIKYIFSALFIVFAAVLIFLYQTNTNFRTIITHNGQTGHQTAFIETMNELKNRTVQKPAELIFGSGLGTAGPLAIKYGTGFISESWYLQLALEIGLIGLAVWLWFMVSILKKLWANKERGLFLSLLSVSIAAIFLHTWADNPAIAYSLFILLGLAVSEVTNKNS